jgi:hypothetical protein
MKNKLIDLNNHLFAQMERLSDEEITVEKLAQEITRSKAITDVAKGIIANAQLALDAQVALNERLVDGLLPTMIGYVSEEKKG